MFTLCRNKWSKLNTFVGRNVPCVWKKPVIQVSNRKIHTKRNRDERCEEDFPQKLKFVNREEELFQVGRKLISNKILDGGKPTLILTGQMYGSGKTSFGAHINKPGDQVVNRLEESVKAKPNQKIALNSLLTSKYVLLDFQQGPLPSPVDVPTLQEALSLMLWLLLPSQTGKTRTEVKKQWHAEGPDLLDVVEKLKLESKQPVLLHFDEVSMIEHPDYSKFFEPCERDRPPGLEKLHFYYNFWRHLVPLLPLDNVHIYCSAKSVSFSLIGFGLLPGYSSPSRVYHAILGSFEVDHILDIVSQTEISTEKQTIAKSLGFGGDDNILRAFCQKLHNLTAGIPRLVRFGLLGAWLSGTNFGNLDEGKLDEAFFVKGNIAKTIKQAPGSRLTYQLINSPQSNYSSMVFMALSGIPIHFDQKITIGNQKVSMLHLTETHEFHVTPVDADNFRIVVPPLILDELKEVMPETSILNLVSKMPLQTIDKGGCLEYVFSQTLAFQIIRHRAKTYGTAFPSLKDTVIADVIVDLHKKNPLVMLPELSTKAKADLLDKEITELKNNPCSRKLRPSHWNFILKYLIETPCIGVLAKKSKSPDILLTLINGLLGISLKLYDENSKHPLSATDIQEEIEKFQLIFDNCSFTYEKRLLLFVAPNSGSLKKIAGKCLSEVDENESSNIIVPNKMQVLVLDDDGLKEIFGDSGLDLLKALANKKETTENGTLITNLVNLFHQ